jgi:uncharacterized YigZ family protein
MGKKESIKVIIADGSGEIVEKKSRFIANVFSVENVSEAETRIAEISKKYWDARHNCYAYVIGENGEQTKCSDNGEPSGTAGKPILEVITGAGITNVLIIVTRYFGGVLLGTGGLVRAYTQAAQAGLADSKVGELVYSRKLTITVDYSRINTIQYLLGQKGINILDSRYAADVQFDICVRDSDIEGVKSDIISKCDGQVDITEGDEGYFLL